MVINYNYPELTKIEYFDDENLYELTRVIYFDDYNLITRQWLSQDPCKRIIKVICGTT